MPIISSKSVDKDIDEQTKKLESCKRSIDLDKQELKLREHIRDNYQEMLDSYEAKTKKIEKAKSHEQDLVDTLKMVKNTVESMKDELKRERDKATTKEQNAERQSLKRLNAANAALKQYVDASHSSEDEDDVKAKIAQLKRDQRDAKNAYDEAHKNLENAELAFNESQAAAYQNIESMKDSYSKHSKNIEDLDIELEDVSLMRAYVNDVISDKTNDEEQHTVIARKERQADQIQKQIDHLNYIRHTYVILNRILYVCIIVFLIFLVFGIIHAFF